MQYAFKTMNWLPIFRERCILLSLLPSKFGHCQMLIHTNIHQIYHGEDADKNPQRSWAPTTVLTFGCNISSIQGPLDNSLGFWILLLQEINSFPQVQQLTVLKDITQYINALSFILLLRILLSNISKKPFFLILIFQTV